MKPIYKLLDAAERIGRVREITLYNTAGPGLIIVTPGNAGNTAKLVVFANFKLEADDDDESCPPYETANMIMQNPVGYAELETIGINPHSTDWKVIRSELDGPDSASTELQELQESLQLLQGSVGR